MNVASITGDPLDSGKRERPQPPDLEGNLSKLKHKASLFGAWTTRYFKVNPDTERLEYFKTRSAALQVPAEPLGYLDLVNITAIRNFDGCSFQIEAGKQVFFLLTESMAEKVSWTRELEDYLLKRQEYERWLASYKAIQRANDVDHYNSNTKK